MSKSEVIQSAATAKGFETVDAAGVVQEGSSSEFKSTPVINYEEVSCDCIKDLKTGAIPEDNLWVEDLFLDKVTTGTSLIRRLSCSNVNLCWEDKIDEKLRPNYDLTLHQVKDGIITEEPLLQLESSSNYKLLLASIPNTITKKVKDLAAKQGENRL